MLLCSMLRDVLMSATCCSTTQNVGLRDYTLHDSCTFSDLTAAVQPLMLPELIMCCIYPSYCFCCVALMSAEPL